jgi:hypothetical protein
LRAGETTRLSDAVRDNMSAPMLPGDTSMHKVHEPDALTVHPGRHPCGFQAVPVPHDAVHANGGATKGARHLDADVFEAAIVDRPDIGY